MLFRQLQYLVALSQEGHFGRAAQRCHVSQPSLSSAVKQLELSLGVPIVMRGRRFLGFTPEGERIVEWAKRVTAQRDAMMVELSRMRKNLEGRIRIGAMPNSSPVLPLFSRALAERHPGVDVDIRFLGMEETRLGLTSYALDVGFTYTESDSLADLKALPVYDERLSLLVPEDSEWALRDEITWREAATLPLCLLDKSMHERRIVDEAFAQCGCMPQAIVTASDSILNLIFHVMYAGLMTVVPTHFAQLPGRLPGTKSVRLIDPEVTRKVGLVWSPTEPTMPMANVMVSIAKQLRKDGVLERRLGELAQ
ncbi:MAG: LysR family transcriptional regulator [Kiloniellales bacterium]|jgi:DNA-binding transcriptional LysR family regulator|nr:LysR family transcriptional regulator [Kiloniellales bacterium]